jgi:formylglycine-generating enzyme required for sulfatase activity
MIMLPLWLLSQTISNIRIEQDELGVHNIKYDLIAIADRSCIVTVTAVKDGKIIHPQAALGSDTDIKAKRDLVFVWNPIHDGYTAEGWTISMSARYVTVEMVLIEGADFIMGDTIGSGGGDEKPLHKVKLSPYYIGKFEVNQSLWYDVTGNIPSYWKVLNLPVEQVSWYDCVEFCNKLSLKENLKPCYSGSGSKIKCDWTANGYRLPTEAEWEYAAKGGSLSKSYLYSGGNAIDQLAWIYENSESQTHSAANKLPNELGLYDMSGNVWEWCWDWYRSYESKDVENPNGMPSGTFKVMRGGAWYLHESACRVSYRYSSRPAMSSYGIGLRLVRSAK